MRPIILFFLILSLTTSNFAQDWEGISPEPQGNSLFDIYSPDQQKIVAVGALGTIMKSTDGGEKWEIDIRVNEHGTNFYSIFYLGANSAWIVGEKGVILQSDNGGISWQNQTSNRRDDLKAIYFINAQTGWIAGANGTILSTRDGGKSWNVQKSSVPHDLNAVFFIDKSTGWMVGNYGTILKTSDGGLHWSSHNSRTTLNLYDLHVFDQNNLLVVGGDAKSNIILRATDGGNYWTSQNTACRSILKKIHFADRNTGWILSASSEILKTTNGGDNWAYFNFWHYESFFGMSFANPETGWIAGEFGIIKRTTNGGATWEDKAAKSYTRYQQIRFVNESTGFLTGINRLKKQVVLQKTVDYGKSWTQIANDITDEFIQLNGVFFNDQNNGWLIGAINDTTNSKKMGGQIYKTTDQGKTWYDQRNGETFEFINALHFTASDSGWIVGQHGLIRKTIDGGKSWQKVSRVDPQTIYYWHAVQFANSKTGWICGINRTDLVQHSAIYKTTDAGQTWERLVTLDQNVINSFLFRDSRKGWLVGSKGLLMETSNGGGTWNSIPLNTTENLKIIKFSTHEQGYIGGDGGTIFHSLDGGKNWESVACSTKSNLLDIDFITPDIAWIVGEGATLLKSRNATVPVELVAFNAQIGDGKIELDWCTASETNNYGFEIQRGTNPTQFTKIGFIQGAGTTTEMQTYFFIDMPNTSGTYYYRLKQVDLDGSHHFSQILEVNFNNQPSAFHLYQNYPNPFNAETVISYELPTPDRVRLTIYNTRGQQVAEILNENKPAGRFTIKFNAEGLPGGVYFVKMESLKWVGVRKGVYVR